MSGAAELINKGEVQTESSALTLVQGLNLSHFRVEEPTWNPQLTVAPAAELNAEGDAVTVTGTGYKPAQGLYVFLCEDIDLPADLRQLALSCRSGAALATPDADGAFELEFSVRQLNVMSRHVVDSADGCGSDCGVVPVMIVEVQPAG